MKSSGIKSPKLKRMAKLFSYRAFPRNNPPTLVAWAVFWGVWIGVMPTIGVAIPLTLLFCLIFRLPKAPAAAASFVSNPFTVPPFYLFAYWLGKAFLHPPPTKFDLIDILLNAPWNEKLPQIWEVISDSPMHWYSFLIGIAIVATIVSSLFWLIAYSVVRSRSHQQQLNRESKMSSSN